MLVVMLWPMKAMDYSAAIEPCRRRSKRMLGGLIRDGIKE